MLALDIILLLVTACFTAEGYRCGVLSSLCALLILVISILGAFIAARTLPYRVESAIEPGIEQILEEHFSAGLESSGNSTGDDTGLTIGGVKYSMESLVQYLNSMGIDAAQSASELTDAADQVVTQYAQELAAQIAQMAAPVVVFVAVFLILYLLLHTAQLLFVQGSAGSAVQKLNSFGGAVIGFLTAAILLTALTTMLQGIGILDDVETGGLIFTLLRKISSLII